MEVRAAATQHRDGERHEEERREGADVDHVLELADRGQRRGEGDDEADASNGIIGWSAPIARALVGARIGDERVVRLPAGEKSYEVIAIRYPDE